MEIFFTELWADFVNWVDLRYFVVLGSLIFVSPLLHVTYNVIRGVTYDEKA